MKAWILALCVATASGTSSVNAASWRPTADACTCRFRQERLQMQFVHFRRFAFTNYRQPG
jgi:hypothetical protein